jgi:hypothetical protein
MCERSRWALTLFRHIVLCSFLSVASDVIAHFAGLFLQSLMPAHAASFTPESTQALLATAATPGPSSSSSPAVFSRARFTTLMLGLPVEWLVDLKLAAAGQTATLFAVRVRAPFHSESSLLLLRACVLRRLHLALFRSTAPTSQASSSSSSSSLAPLPPVSQRTPTSSSAGSDAEIEAATWMTTVLREGRAVAAACQRDQKTNFATANAITPRPNGMPSAAAAAAPAPLSSHYQRRLAQLLATRKQLLQAQLAPADLVRLCHQLHQLESTHPATPDAASLLTMTPSQTFLC